MKATLKKNVLTVHADTIVEGFFLGRASARRVDTSVAMDGSAVSVSWGVRDIVGMLSELADRKENSRD